MSRWTIAAAATAAFFFVVAVSHAVYDVTSPVWLSWHVLLRKVYSIGAFTLVGYTFIRAGNGRFGNAGKLAGAAALYVGAYSALIEVGQYLHGSREGLAWNTFDTLCGAAGGVIAAGLERFRLRLIHARPPR